MSLFLQGLKTARELAQLEGMEALNKFIEDIEANMVETTSVRFEVEAR